MQHASASGSAASFGCLVDKATETEGEWVQHFQYDGAVLFASLLGGAVADSAVELSLSLMGGGSLSVNTLGGQVLDAIPCWQHGDIRPFVNEEGVIDQLYIRASTYGSPAPILVPVSMIGAYAKYFFDNGGVLLAPLGPATAGYVGGEQQQFLNPDEPQDAPITLTAIATAPSDSFTPAQIWETINGPNTPIPYAFRAGGH